MPTEQDRRGALEALERILNRGGEADDVLREVVAVLGGLYGYAGIDFVESGSLAPGPSRGTRPEEPGKFPIEFQGSKVAELLVGPPAASDEAFLRRAALIVSPYCLVGWDTGGEPWEP